MGAAVSARRAALETLIRCRRDGAWAGAAMDSLLKKYGLDRREAALASRLCLGVLENTALCDFYLSAFCTASLEPKVRDILRLGVYQLLFLDRVPDRAAVSESVELCRASGCARAAGLVNAVLRRVSENRDDLPEIPGQGTASYLSTRYSHPIWLCQRLCADRGYTFAEAFLAANNRPAPLTIQVNTLRVTPEEYTRALERAEIPYTAYPELPGCLTLADTPVTALPGFEEGLFYVQDRAARLAVAAAGPRPGMRMLDACASPGGKSFGAALAMENRGEILSCDLHAKKLVLVESGAERLGIDIIQTRPGDARRLAAQEIGTFDLAIADVPCSGLGVIRKKPEIRTKKAEELQQLPVIQSEIMDQIGTLIRPGGVLLYSTCTVLPEENENVVSSFLNKHPEFRPMDFQLGPVKSENGAYTFWPNVDDTDGFFVAKLRKAE